MINSTSSATQGLNCPKCKFTIKFTMDMLLHNKAICCPSCGLRMDMQVPTEMKVHLQEISMAEKMVQKAKTFRR